jgi:DNA primase
VAGRIRQEDIEAVRERTDLVKLVSGYLTLKKAGHDSLVGVCPFHTEKTPSFSVSPSKQVYYCFGCGAGGDAVRFLREVEHLDFRETIERLAKDAGVTLRFEGETPAERRAASRRASLQKANDEAFALYHRTLMESPEAEPARRYLKERGIDPQTAERFEVGYAPATPDFLLRRLAPRYSPELLLEAGLVLRDAGGNVRDRFRGRITFPVRDLSGRGVGIGARILPREDGSSDDGPKYLNSPETPVYKKGEVLYHLDAAKAAITRSGEAFVVEGYTDVIALAHAGLDSGVATCGTALGEGHFRLLSRFAQRVVLAFDSDEAGARAAERAFAFHENFALQPVVLVLPDGLDPADFVKERGADALKELAAQARPLVDYMIRRSVGRFDTSTVEAQTQAVQASFPILEQLSDPVRQREYAHLLAELAGVDESSVLLTLERKLAGKPVEVAQALKRVSVNERVEREMLRLLARDTSIFEGFVGKLSEDHFQSAQNRRLFGLLVEAKGDVRALIADADDDKTRRLLSALTLEMLDGEPTERYAEQLWYRLQEFLLQRRSAALRQRLQKLNPQTDDGYDALFSELISLDGELRRLKEQADGQSNGFQQK